MNKYVGEAHQIVIDRGYDITQEDVDNIWRILLGIEFTDDQGQREAAWVWEGVAMIVNDPRYTGDAKSLD